MYFLHYSYRVLIVLILIFISSCHHAKVNQGVVNEYGLSMQPDFYNPCIYQVDQLAYPVVVDGNDNDHGWNDIKWSNQFVSIVDGGLQNNLLDTRFKMAVSGDSVYLIVKVNDDNIWASSKFDVSSCFDDDILNIYIDDDNDEYNYLVFHVNPLGSFFAEFYERNKSTPDYRFYMDTTMAKCKVKVKGTLNQPGDKDDFWQVEIAFPFDILYKDHYLLQKQGSWKFNVRRNVWQTVLLDNTYKKVINADVGKAVLIDSWEWSYLWGNRIDNVELWGDCIFDKRFLSDQKPFNLQVKRRVSWELRNIFYAQQVYFRNHKRYAKKIADLKETGFLVSELKYNPEIRAGKNNFKAILYISDIGLKYIINSQGKIIKEPIY